MNNYLIFIPVYNEEKNILSFFYNLVNFIDFKTDSVLIIDDNSIDNTRLFLNLILEELRELGLENNIKIIFN
jgi:cellulose synthase/poly-beta-1,6-N-acetylglucosamine synthase-like glycosyltransferase